MRGERFQLGLGSQGLAGPLMGSLEFILVENCKSTNGNGEAWRDDCPQRSLWRSYEEPGLWDSNHGSQEASGQAAALLQEELMGRTDVSQLP